MWRVLLMCEMNVMVLREPTADILPPAICTCILQKNAEANSTVRAVSVN